MRQSQLFNKTLKKIAKEREAISNQLLLRGGFIDQTTAGVFTFLPLGFKVLKKIENIIRKKMEESPINGQEILMPVLHPKENWQKTGRWENLDILFKLKGSGGKEYALGPTHEEIISPLAKKFVFSYKDLPIYLFQIQTKFRDELRVKSGLMRTREFLMKDLYSFHTSEKDLDNYYEKVANAYQDIFQECGIYKPNSKERITYQTWASGGTFSKYSHEFQTITESGEDTIYICKKCYSAINKDIKNEIKICPNKPCDSRDFEERRSIEVANIFKLGTKYSLPFDLKFRDKDGKEKPVLMGCYGMGLGRLMAAIVEIHHDERGIIWPEEVAPFQVHLIEIINKEEKNAKKVKKTAEGIYQNLQKSKIEVLYDDREEKTAGEKLVEADLIGIPIRIVASARTLLKDSIEIKKRNEKIVELIKINKLVKFLKPKS
jgi:prolyl-tRNA synthetase